jgi:MFS family permease
MSGRPDGDAVARKPALGLPTKVLMAGGGMLTTLASIGLTAVLPQIEAALARTATDALIVKQLVTVVGLTMIIGAPLAAFLVERIGMRLVLLSCSLIYTAAGTAGLYLDSLPALLVSRLFVGLTAAGISTISMTLINTRLEGNERARWMGIHVGTALILTLIFHPVLGWLGEFGWRWPFGVYFIGLPLAAAALLVDGSVKGRASNDGEAAEARGLLRWFPVRYALLSLIIGALTYTPLVYVPFVLRQTGDVGPSVIALVFLADSLIGAILSLLFGRTRRYISSDMSFVISFGCTGAGMAIAALASSFEMVVAGMIVFGFGIGWFVPNLMTAAARKLRASQQGRAVGLLKSAYYGSAPLAVFMLEPLTRVYGPKSALGAVACVALVGSAVYLVRSLRGRAASAAAVSTAPSG